MKHPKFFMPVFLFLCGQVLAQQGAINGSVIDSGSKTSLPNASVCIVNTIDSSLVSFLTSDEKGFFFINKLNYGSYLCVISHVGYTTQSKPFFLSEVYKNHNLGIISLSLDSFVNNVVIAASPVNFRGDTIEYNTRFFKIKQNAVVEDLLKKMPGITVEKDGTIKFRGQIIKKILVDGQPFFGNDPKIASKNLLADVVGKVQLFEKKSERSEFTGFDDGNGEAALNIVLKPDKKGGIFGKASAALGPGSQKPYNINGNINRYKKGEQLSVLGKWNNINDIGYSFSDGIAFSGGIDNFMTTGGQSLNQSLQFKSNPEGANGQGIAKSQSVGINFNLYKTAKLKFSGSYFYNATDVFNQSTSITQTNLSDSFITRRMSGQSNSSNNNHRINLSIEWGIDSFTSIKFIPSLVLQQNRRYDTSVFFTLGESGIALSTGNQKLRTLNNGYQLSTNTILKHKFHRIGRTVYVQINTGDNKNKTDDTQFTNTHFLAQPSIKADSIDQQNVGNLYSNNFGVDICYSEPINRNAVVEWVTYHNSGLTNNSRSNFGYDISSGLYNKLNQRLSSQFITQVINTGTGINFRKIGHIFNASFGVSIQKAILQNQIQGLNSFKENHFWNILPNAQAQWKMGFSKNLRATYRGFNTIPNIYQLQPIIDSTDIWNVKRGNPFLKQEYTHNFQVVFNHFDMVHKRVLFVTVFANTTNNKIISTDSIGMFGNRNTSYENAKGAYNLNGNMYLAFPLKVFGIDFSLNSNATFTYSKNFSRLNGILNAIENYSLGKNLTLNYAYKESFDISLRTGFNYNKARYSVQPLQNAVFYSLSSSFENNWYLPKGLTVSNELEYAINKGRTTGYNPRIILWNASITKPFLKNKKAEIKLSGINLLDNNFGFQRNTSSNFIEDRSFTVLKRYFLVTFVYFINSSGTAESKAAKRLFGNLSSGKGIY